MKRTNDFLVGLAVLVVAAATIVGTVWLRQIDVGKRKHEVVARFRDVGNARIGNAAVIRGVKAGRIRGIELADDGWVHVTLELDPEIRMPQDPVVLLNQSTLFGEWQATVTERSSLPRDENVRQQVVQAASVGTIPGATLPDIAQLTAVAGQIAGDVASVATRVETAFDDAAARELRASIRNFANMSSTLSRTVNAHQGDLDSLSTQLQGAARTLGRTAASVERMAARVDASATSGDVRKIIADVGFAAAELRATSSQVRILTERLGGSQARLDALLANTDSVLAKMNAGRGTLGLLLNDPSLYRNHDSLATQLRGLVTDFRANPRRYINLSIF